MEYKVNWLTKMIRAAFCMSQKEFGKVMGVSGQSISNWETKYIMPGPAHFRRLLDLYRDIFVDNRVEDPCALVRIYMALYGYTRVDMAEMFDVDYDEVNNWIFGEYPPSEKVMREINAAYSRYLGLPRDKHMARIVAFHESYLER